MSEQKTAHCRRCGEELDPMTDDTERELCIDCAEEVEDEEYEKVQDADELDSMIGAYEGDW